jgi:hypothetical protein
MGMLNRALVAALMAGAGSSFAGSAGAVPLAASASLRSVSTSEVQTVQWQRWRSGYGYPFNSSYPDYSYGYTNPAYSWNYNTFRYGYSNPANIYFSNSPTSYGYADPGYSYGYAPRYRYRGAVRRN